MKTVIIFGGSGYVGGHIIRRIAKNGYKIIVPYQRQINESKLRLLGITGQIIPLYFRSLKEKKITNLIKKSNIILNLKTNWDENHISFQGGILDFNIDLVNIIKNHAINNQFIYFSGIGSDKKTDSNRSKAIYKSEQYIRNNLENSIIIRPGIILGGGDQFTKALIPIFKASFFIPLFGNGLTKLQPVFIDDVSMGVNNIIMSNLIGNHIFEFVGYEVFTYKDLYNFFSKCLNKTRVLLPIPLNLARLAVRILEKTPFSPIKYEQLRLFEEDNIASSRFKKLHNINVEPQDIREIIKKIIKKNI